MNRQYHKWFSARLDREMELLVFGHGGDRVLVFPTRRGRFFDYEDWGLVHALRWRIESGALQLFCVDSVDAQSLYAQHVAPCERLARHRSYEEYILREVLPLTRDLNGSARLVAHGCSLGAYHAVNIAFRHPNLFGKVVALSGRYDLTRSYPWFPDLFGGHYDADVYFHTPNHFVPNLHDAGILERLRSLDIRLAIGNADTFFADNHRLSEALWDKGVWHALDVWPGEAHRPRFWREMVQRHF